MTYTDPRTSLKQLEEELENGNTEDVIDSMSDVVNDFEVLAVETTQMRRDLISTHLDDRLADERRRQQVNLLAQQLIQASTRRGNLLSQVIAYTRGGEDTGRGIIKKSVSSMIAFEDELRESVDAIDRELGETPTPPDISGAGLSLPASSVVPDETVTAIGRFRNPGNTPIRDVRVEVEGFPESLNIENTPSRIDSIGSESAEEISFDVTPTESGIMKLRVTATAGENESAILSTSFFSRTPEEAEKYAQTTRGDEDDENSAVLWGGVIAGSLAGAGTVGYILRRKGRTPIKSLLANSEEESSKDKSE
jgi:hypothetical protein